MALRLKEFREVYGAELSRNEAIDLWGSELSPEILEKFVPDTYLKPITKSKMKIANDLAKEISTSWVKYIGVSGSVASNTPKKEDDIDLFIVVKDHTSWILRVYFKLKLGKKVVWFGQEDQADKACVNYICEERGLSFPHQDIFTLNELTLLKGIYNDEYYDKIIDNNRWVFDKFFLKAGDGKDPLVERSNIASIILLLPLNFLFFSFQLLYMIFMGHKPDIRRLMKGFTDGRIEHFPEDFRVEKVKNFNPST